jgi:hypothetical protein
MQSELASQNLALISYRVATDPNYVQQLPRQIQAGQLDSGETITAEDAAALEIFLEQINASNQPSLSAAVDTNESIIWIG